MKRSELTVEGYFCNAFGTDPAGLRGAVREALQGAEDGELFVERTESESVTIHEGKVTASRNTDQGFGLRRVNGDRISYASSEALTLPAIAKVGAALRELNDANGEYIAAEEKQSEARYAQASPLTLTLPARVQLLKEVDAYARKESDVVEVHASISGEYTRVLIVRADGTIASEIRPLVHFSITVFCVADNKRESGSASFGGRHSYDDIVGKEIWRRFADEAITEARDILRADECPSGEMPVVLGPGWAAVLLHEAIGHGLEGDFAWRGTTVFKDKIGKRIASELVTVVDDGTLPARRGSLSFDDEGTPTECTLLIDKGILVGFMHDRESARKLGKKPTGNGRRESYEFPPQVRMRNTVMVAGDSPPDTMFRNMKRGLYMPKFRGGSVDPITGKFTFRSRLAYKIENGAITTPVREAAMMGDCATVLLGVDMVGNDIMLDHGGGTCGKGGQGVPVGVGQPTLRIAQGVTIGGTLVDTK